MALIGSVPRRCVNLPPGSLRTLVSSVLGKKVQQGAAIEEFYTKFAQWLGVSHVLGAASGRSAFQLALEALGLEKGAEIIFPVFTFPVIPLVAKLLGYQPVFCDVDPRTYNSGPEHIEPKITDKTGAILATHLFGQPCPMPALSHPRAGGSGPTKKCSPVGRLCPCLRCPGCRTAGRHFRRHRRIQFCRGQKHAVFRRGSDCHFRW